MSKPFKVHELLSGDELAELEAFAREPGRTTDECHEWLLGKGYTLSRGAVGNWLRELKDQAMRERLSGAAEFARSMKAAVQGGQMEDIADAAMMQLVQVVFEQAAGLQSDGRIDPLDVQRMTRSLANLVGTKAKLVSMLAEKFDRETAKKAGPQKRALTQEDLDEVRKAVFG